MRRALAEAERAQPDSSAHWLLRAAGYTDDEIYVHPLIDADDHDDDQDDGGGAA